MSGDKLSREDSEALAKRRRARNIAVFIALLALCALFYAITIVKLHTPDLGQ